MSKISNLLSRIFPSLAKNKRIMGIEIEVRDIEIFASPEDLNKLMSNPKYFIPFFKGIDLAKSTGFISNYNRFVETKLDAEVLMDPEFDSEEVENPEEKLRETLRSVYDLYMKNVELLKENKDLIPFAQSIPDGSMYVCTYSLDNPEAEHSKESIMSDLLFYEEIKTLDEIITKEEDPEEKEKMSMIRNAFLLRNPHIIGEFYDIGVPRLFGDDPIVDVATHLGGVSYDEASKATSEYFSGYVDFHIDSNYKDGESQDKGFYPVLYACLKYLPQEKVEEIKRRVGNDKKENAIYRKMVMNYQKNSNKENDRQDS